MMKGGTYERAGTRVNAGGGNRRRRGGVNRRRHGGGLAVNGVALGRQFGLPVLNTRATALFGLEANEGQATHIHRRSSVPRCGSNDGTGTLVLVNTTEADQGVQGRGESHAYCDGSTGDAVRNGSSVSGVGPSLASGRSRSRVGRMEENYEDRQMDVRAGAEQERLVVHTPRRRSMERSQLSLLGRVTDGHELPESIWELSAEKEGYSRQLDSARADVDGGESKTIRARVLPLAQHRSQLRADLRERTC